MLKRYMLVSPYHSNVTHNATNLTMGSKKCYKELKNTSHINECNEFIVMDVDSNRLYNFQIHKKNQTGGANPPVAIPAQSIAQVPVSKPKEEEEKKEEEKTKEEAKDEIGEVENAFNETGDNNNESEGIKLDNSLVQDEKNESRHNVIIQKLTNIENKIDNLINRNKQYDEQKANIEQLKSIKRQQDQYDDDICVIM
uniref:Uncharacterized protein n=1 Tax=viral metagenome TaxID=1070528 RepID=A0A6C0EA41_9ZZZZ